MEPHHHHEHSHRLTSLNKAFIIGIALNITFVIVEFGVGFYYNSLGLLSDACKASSERRSRRISCKTGVNA